MSWTQIWKSVCKTLTYEEKTDYFFLRQKTTARHVS